MKIADERSDALEILKRIHTEMRVLQGAIAELEYLIYETDERVQINFFERGEHDKGRSQKGIKTH